MSKSSDPKTIVCFGDSITWGFNAEAEIPAQRHAFADRWTQILAKDLGAEYHLIEEGLNGRTTVFDDPVRGGMSGLSDLTNVLKSHKPISLLVIMLGSNDLKTRFGLSAQDIAVSLGRLLDLASKSDCGVDGQPPEILVLIPPVLSEEISNIYFSPFEMESSLRTSRELRETYPPIAEQFGAHCLDMAQFVTASRLDGLHLDGDMQKPFADALAPVIRTILGG